GREGVNLFLSSEAQSYEAFLRKGMLRYAQPDKTGRQAFPSSSDVVFPRAPTAPQLHSRTPADSGGRTYWHCRFWWCRLGCASARNVGASRRVGCGALG